MFALMHSELSEALEGIRKDKMDDHIPTRKSEDVELADFMIRLFDYAGNRKLDLDYYTHYNIPYSMLHENKAECIADIHKALTFAYTYDHKEAEWFGTIINYILAYCQQHKIDIFATIEDKHAYNKVRSDHKNEARIAAGGKKF